MTTATTLIRVPSKRRQQMRSDYITASTPKYDYTSADGRWYIHRVAGVGGGWKVTTPAANTSCTSAVIPTRRSRSPSHGRWPQPRR